MEHLIGDHSVMVDLETVGKKAGCGILSIGAVAFDITGLHSNFYEVIDPRSCREAGLAFDQNTLDWWQTQSSEAREEAFSGTTPLREALERFSVWWLAIEAEKFWCHGATFDAPILEAAYEACDMPIPWKFWNVRDTRTIYDLAQVQPDRSKGVHHNAFQDAVVQAQAMIEAVQKLSAKPGDEPDGMPRMSVEDLTTKLDDMFGELTKTHHISTAAMLGALKSIKMKVEHMVVKNTIAQEREEAEDAFKHIMSGALRGKPE